ncbi:hypothetical protein LXL04_039657 [Taraxacum kok-saghyz]
MRLAFDHTRSLLMEAMMVEHRVCVERKDSESFVFCCAYPNKLTGSVRRDANVIWKKGHYRESEKACKGNQGESEKHAWRGWGIREACVQTIWFIKTEMPRWQSVCMVYNPSERLSIQAIDNKIRCNSRRDTYLVREDHPLLSIERFASVSLKSSSHLLHHWQHHHHHHQNSENLQEQTFD